MHSMRLSKSAVGWVDRQSALGQGWRQWLVCTSKTAQRSDEDVLRGAWSLRRTQGALSEVEFLLC